MRRTTPVVCSHYHPLTLKTLIWKQFSCPLYWLRLGPLCLEPSVVWHLFSPPFSLHFLPPASHRGRSFTFFKDSIHFFGYCFLLISCQLGRQQPALMTTDVVCIYSWGMLKLSTWVVFLWGKSIKDDHVSTLSETIWSCGLKSHAVACLI